MKLRIPIVDDEECIRDTFKWYLEDLGHEVIVASDPMQCSVYKGHLCSEDQACIDVLFTDYRMPRMNGLEFIELMSKKGCKLAAQNKYIMSGNTADIDMDKAKELECFILEKPIRLDLLDSIIAEIECRKESPNNLPILSDMNAACK